MNSEYFACHGESEDDSNGSSFEGYSSSGSEEPSRSPPKSGKKGLPKSVGGAAVTTALSALGIVQKSTAAAAQASLAQKPADTRSLTLQIHAMKDLPDGQLFGTQSPHVSVAILPEKINCGKTSEVPEAGCNDSSPRERSSWRTNNKFELKLSEVMTVALCTCSTWPCLMFQ